MIGVYIYIIIICIKFNIFIYYMYMENLITFYKIRVVLIE